MSEDLLDYWLRIIRPIFPAGAWIVSNIYRGDYIIQIDWKLEADTSKSSKRSKKIQIIIDEEVIDDYLDMSKDKRDLSDAKMIEWLSAKYYHFNPDYQTITYNSSSDNKWRISRAILRS